MNKLIFSILIFTGCVLPRNVENYKVIKMPSYSLNYDSNYYEFTNSGKIKREVTYQDSGYSGPIKTIVEFSKKGRIVLETQIIYKFSMINKNIYYDDKYNSLKLQETYQKGKLSGYSYGYFKQDSVNQKNEIIFSKFFYIDNKLVGEGYFFYKNIKKMKLVFFQNFFILTIS
jgi:hypothetical protein